MTVQKTPYVIILSGPAGSGKSTVAVSLWKTLNDNPAYIDLDTLKNMIWQAPSDDHHLDLASLNALSIMKNYLNHNHSVILDKAFGKFDYIRPFIDEAAKQGIPYHYYKLTAPLNVLIERNRKRRNLTTKQLADQARWRSFKAPDESIRRMYDFFEKNAHPRGRELDSSEYSLQEILTIISNDVAINT